MKRRFWTKDELADLRRIYPHYHTEDVAFLFERSVSAVYGRANTLGLRKTRACLELCYRTRKPNEGSKRTQFRAGHAPWNKGMKGVNFGGKETQFKKGNRPHTWVPVGTRIRAKTRGSWYWKVKTAEPNEWRFVHHLIWEKARGPIPKGRNLIFWDKNPDNLKLSNLVLVSKRMNMIRNSYLRYPTPIRKAIMAIGALTRQINKRKKEA